MILESRRFLVLTALSLASVASAQGPREAVEVLDSSGSRIQVRVSFDVPTWTGAPGDPYAYPGWPDLLPDGDPGSPGLPARVVRVALPPAGEVTLSVQSDDLGRAGSVRFPPIPSQEPLPPSMREGIRPDPVARPVMIEGEAYKIAEFGPQAEITAIGVERGLRIANILVRPVRWNPVTGEAVWSRSVTMDLTIAGAAGTVQGRPSADRVAKKSWDKELVNPADASRWVKAPQEPADVRTPDAWFDDAWLKVTLPQNGVYRLSRESLRNAGVPVETIGPGSLRVFAGPLVSDVAWGGLGWESTPGGAFQAVWMSAEERPGCCQPEEGIGASGGLEEVAIWVQGEDERRIDGIVFYGLGPDNFRDRFGLPEDKQSYFSNPYSRESVYWVTWSPSLPGSPLRMAAEEGTPHAGAEIVSESEARLHSEENTIYDPAMYWVEYAWEGWFWEFLASTARGGNRFLVDLPHLVPGTTLDAHVRLWGAQRPVGGGTGQDDKHHVSLTVNDAEGGLHIWGGGLTPSFMPYDVQLEGIPARTPSSFVIKVLEVGTNPNRFDMVYLTWIDVAYRRALDAGGAPAELEIDAGPSGRTVRVTSPPSGALRAFDVTDFRRPARIENPRLAGTLEFRVEDAGKRVVALTTEERFLSPLRMERLLAPAGGWLRDTSNPIDYVIVTHEDFAQEAEVLAEWRRNHLYGVTDQREARVHVVTVEEIMNEFAWGMLDPVAIRYFLEYAFRYYGTGDDRLAYCVFLGDHSYDFRDYEGTGGYVPSWEDNRDPLFRIGDGNTQYVSDETLVRFDGRNDIFTDLYIGRIPSRTAAEARAVIRDKVILSEDNPDLGPWRVKSILVADDICQTRKPDNRLGFAHLIQSESLARLIPKVFDVEKVYLYEYGPDCIYDGKADAKQALLSSWNDGAWYVNYIGHGGDVVLADEHVLDLADVPVLSNTGRYGIFGAFSCSVGKFNKPLQEGLGEALVCSPRGGALVAAAATHLTNSGSNSSTNNEFVRRLFPDAPTEPTAIGVAMMEAKRVNPGESNKYACLGDPASLLGVPGTPMTLTGPSSLERGKPATFEVTVEGMKGRDGTLDLVARDASEVVTKNTLGETFQEHIERMRREFPTFSIGNAGISSYIKAGAVLFRGQSNLQSDTSSMSFTVPSSLRGGGDGKVRAYAWGDRWDAMGVVAPMQVGGTVPPSTDQDGPSIEFDLESAVLFPGDPIAVTLQDASGINLTQLFDFRSILVKVADVEGIEQLRLDVTERFEYDLGSATQGRAEFVVPDLPEGTYTLSASAFDNLNNKGSASLEVTVSPDGSGGGFSEVASYPNPFNPELEPTRILFRLDRPGGVSLRIWSVSGRLVHRAEMEGKAGRNAFTWTGKDDVLDPVANGVYIVRLTSKPEGGEEIEIVERVVVLR